MNELAAIVALAAGTAMFLAGRWVRAQLRRDLTHVLNQPWYLWPLVRVVVGLWKREAHKDLFKVCGWYKREGGIDQPTRRAGSYIAIRRRDGDYWVKIKVAPAFDQGDEETDAIKNAKKQVVNQARGTLDLGPVDWTWNFRFLARHVVLTPKKVVPKVALGMAPDIAALVAANLTPTQVVPAIGKGDQPIIHDAEDDAPHVLISGTTNGGGKTSTLRTFGIQYYSTGSDLLIVDTIRQFSHVGWAIDPTTQQPWSGIVYADTIAEAATWITRAGQVMMQRGEITKQAMKRGETVTWPRLTILLDDMNGTMAELKRQGHTEAIHYLSELLWASRGVGMCIISAFQRGSAHAAGGGDQREAYGLRIWADGSGKTGDMLADQVDKAKRPTPKPHTIQPGHSVFIYSSLAFEAQRIYYTDDEARTICATEARRRHRRAIETSSCDDSQRRDQHQRDQHAIAGQDRHDGTNGDDGQQQKLHGVHEDTVPKAVFDVKGGWLAEYEREDQAALPDAPGSWGGAAASPHITLRPPNHAEGAVSGSSLSPAHESSMQEIEAISRIDESDGETNYLTLSDLVGRDWCTTTYHSLRTYANPEKDYDFPDPIKGFSNPRRWSERAVRNWLEDFQAQGGAKSYGVYFVRPPGSATVKIGRTGNLKARLRRWNLGEQCVLRWLPCSSKADSIRLEDAQHKQYHYQHDHLEWFWIEGDLARDLGLPEVVRS